MFTNEEKKAGELAARNLSEKARAFYAVTDPLVIYQYGDQKMYAVNFAGDLRDGLTLSDLDKLLCEYADAIEE